MIEDIKIELKDFLNNKFNANFVVEAPKNKSLGDISIPSFALAKILKKSPPECANELKNTLGEYSKHILFEEINITGGFVNIKLNKGLVAQETIKEIYGNDTYGQLTLGEGKTVVIDYSSPNIAKPFGIGHLRSTIIGQALKNINIKCGYDVVGINYIGDWGTQFGKVIYAYKTWSSKEKVDQDGVKELVALYIRFHKEADINPKLDDIARQIFKDLENGNQEYLELWKWFKDVSLTESKEVYDLLGVSFESYNGEAFYNDKMGVIVDELKEKELLVEDKGANVVMLGDKYPPALIQKSDGSTLYLTRDLASIKYRRDNYNFSKALYVVGGEQKLHFNQFKEVVKLMGYEDHELIEHIHFGLVLQNGKKMSTRKGRTVLLIDVLKEAVSIAKKTIEEKNPDIENKDFIAEKIGVGAIIFNDLKNFRTHDVEFDAEQMLKFEGQTGPYLQYTCVRINSLITNANVNLDNNAISTEVFDNTHYFDIITLCSQYKNTIKKACEDSAPSYIAKYLLSLASAFNSFYGNVKILDDNELVKNTNLLLSSVTKTILQDGMKLLGIVPIEKM